MLIKKAINHFLDFHKGFINIILHMIAIAGLFYSIYKLNWLLFAVFLVILESGHIYNHIAGIKKYDFRIKVNLFRTLIFLIMVIVFYFLSSWL